MPDRSVAASRFGWSPMALAVLAWLAFGASTAGAQHFDMLYGVSDDHVKTGATDFEALTLVPDIRVFSNTFTFNGAQGGLWTDDPGHTSNDSPPGMDPLPPGAELHFDIVVEPHTGLNLSYWDGDTYPITWGPVPNGETIEISAGTDLAVADGGSEDVDGFLIDTEPDPGGVHTHHDFHLRPAGATGGVYLLTLKASIVPVLPADAAAESPRFWIVFRYDESTEDWENAVAWVEANLDVPECQDGYDNDGDGCVDADGGSLGAGNEDPGCDDLLDESEASDGATCTVEPFCGNGIVDPGEDCDDGNTVETDMCANDCTAIPEPAGPLMLLAGAVVLWRAGRRPARH